jgi:hypothetical protein
VRWVWARNGLPNYRGTITGDSWVRRNGEVVALAAYYGTFSIVSSTDLQSWVTNAYTSECKTSGADAWLQITRTAPAKAAPTLTGTEGPTWGLHDFDVAAPLGNLLELVRAQAAAYRP